MRKGFSLLESLIALAVVMTGLLVLLSVFTLSRRQGDENRSRLYGKLIVRNLVEEVLAHRYGTPAPPDWSQEQEPRVVVEGRTVVTRITTRVETALDQGGNGSLFGKTPQTSDVVRVTASWKDEHDGSTQEVSAVVTVRRENAFGPPR